MCRYFCWRASMGTTRFHQTRQDLWAQAYEWGMGTGQHLPRFAKHMFILLSICWSLTLFSTLIMLNRPFRLTTFQLFTLQSQRSKPFTRHGQVGLTVQNISHLPQPFTQQVQRLTSTMKGLPNLLRTSCRWVWSLTLALKVTNIQYF